MITITITIAIAIAIAIAIISISPRPNVHTHALNQLEGGTRFRWKIWVGDLLSPRSNCLPFLCNLRLQLSISWPWGIVRSCHSGCAKDKVQTMISTNVMISATIHRPPSAAQHTTRHIPPTKHYPPYSTSLTPHGTRRLQLTPSGAWCLQLSKPLDRTCRSVHVSI